MRKFAREAVEKYPSIARLNEAISGARRMGSINTVESYVKGINRFIAFIGFEDPEKVLAAIQSGQVNAASQVDQFIDKELEKYAHATVRNRIFGVKKWFELSGIKVDWDKIELPTSAEISETDRAPSKDELKLLLDHASGARDRAAILVLSSSGLRIGTLLSLKVGDADFSYPDVARIKVERKRGRKFMGKRMGSQGRVFFTFITPEARKSLQEYLEERKRTKEKLTSESPLIALANSQGKFTTLENFERVWYRLLKRSGLNEKSVRWYKLHVHTLRKYFRSNCIGVDASYREHWMGHKSGYLDESYFRAEEQNHLAEYRKAIPHLTVYSTPLEEKQMRSRMLVDFAKLQGFNTEELKKLEDILARAKDLDEGIKEFKRFKEESNMPSESNELKTKKSRTAYDGNGKYLVAHNEDEMIQKLHEGFRLVQSLNNDKYLLEIQ
jgi:integrase